MGILRNIISRYATWLRKPLGICVWCEAKTPGASACNAEHQAAFDEYERSGIFA